MRKGGGEEGNSERFEDLEMEDGRSGVSSEYGERKGERKRENGNTKRDRRKKRPERWKTKREKTEMA